MVPAALLLAVVSLADLVSFAPLPAAGRTFSQAFPRLAAGVSVTPTDTPERKRLAEQRELLLLNYELITGPASRHASTILNILQVARDTGMAAVSALPPGEAEAWCREVVVIQRLVCNILEAEITAGRYAAADISRRHCTAWAWTASALRTALADRQ